MRYIVIILFFLLPGIVSSQVKKTPVTKPVTNKVIKKPPVAKSKTATPSKKTVATNKKTDSSALVTKPITPLLSLTAREQEMVNEINILRADPPKYCAYVDVYLQKFNSSKQEKATAKELIDILKKTKPLSTLTVNMIMYSDAKKFGAEMAKEDELDHSSLPYYENLSLGHKDIRDAMVDMLIDDGIPDRGHRNNLLNEKIKQVAVVELPGTINGLHYCYILELK